MKSRFLRVVYITLLSMILTETQSALPQGSFPALARDEKFLSTATRLSPAFQQGSSTLDKFLDVLWETVASDTGSSSVQGRLTATNYYDPVSFNPCTLMWKHTQITRESTDSWDVEDTKVDYNELNLGDSEESFVTNYRDDEGNYHVGFNTGDRRLIKVNRGVQTKTAKYWEEWTVKDRFEKRNVNYADISFGKQGINNKKASEDFAQNLRNTIYLCQGVVSQPVPVVNIKFPQSLSRFSQAELSMRNLSLDGVFQTIKPKINDYAHAQVCGFYCQDVKWEFRAYEDCFVALQETRSQIGYPDVVYLYKIPLADLRFPISVEGGNGKVIGLRTTYDKRSIIKEVWNSETQVKTEEQQIYEIHMYFTNQEIAGSIARYLVHAIKMCRK